MKMEEDEVGNEMTRKNQYALHWEQILLPSASSGEDNHPPEPVMKKSKSSGSGSAVDAQVNEKDDSSALVLKADLEIREIIARYKKNLQNFGNKLADKGQKIKETIRRLEDELKRRNKLQSNKDVLYSANVSIRCNMKGAVDIRIRLRDVGNLLDSFRDTCFGRWVDIGCTNSDPSLVHLLLQLQLPQPDTTRHLMFIVGGRRLKFGSEEFLLVTGLRFGDQRWIPGAETIVGIPFCQRVFPGRLSLTGLDVSQAFTDRLFDLDDDDVIRVCSLHMLFHCFLGQENKMFIDPCLLHLVDDLHAWNKFPWGSYIWDKTFPKLRDALRTRAPQPASYSLTGFVWAFKIWIYEVLPYSIRSGHCDYTPGRIPRSFCWKRSSKSIKWESVLRFFTTATTLHELVPIEALVPTGAELATDWYPSSIQYITGAIPPPVAPPSVQPPPMAVSPLRPPPVVDPYLGPHVTRLRPVLPRPLVPPSVGPQPLVPPSIGPRPPLVRPLAWLSEAMLSEALVRIGSLEDQLAGALWRIDSLERQLPRAGHLDLSAPGSGVRSIPSSAKRSARTVALAIAHRRQKVVLPKKLRSSFTLDMSKKRKGRVADQAVAPVRMTNIRVEGMTYVPPLFFFPADTSRLLAVADRDDSPVPFSDPASQVVMPPPDSHVVLEVVMPPSVSHVVSEKDSTTFSPDSVAGNKPSECFCKSQFGVATNALTVDATKHDSLTDEKMQKIVNELVNVGISETDVGKAAEVCYNDPVKVKVLFALPSHLRRFYVLGFLRN